MGDMVTDRLLQEIASLSLEEFEGLARAIESIGRGMHDEAWGRSRDAYKLEYEAAWERVGADDIAAAIPQAEGR